MAVRLVKSNGRAGLLGIRPKVDRNGVFGRTRMHRHRLPHAQSHLELCIDQRSLVRRRRVVTIRIEADLPDRDDFRQPRERFQFGQHSWGHVVGFVRVEADRRKEQRRARGQFKGQLVRRRVVAEDRDAFETGGTGAVDDAIEVREELRVLDVAVRIERPGHALAPASSVSIFA